MKTDLRLLPLVLFCALFGTTSSAAAQGGLKPVKDSDPARLASVDEDAGDSDVEVIKERYEDGNIKIEREVIRDVDDNYVNHGSWKKYDTAGNVVAEGQYDNGIRQGTWNAWFRRGETAMLDKKPFSLFAGPYISQASFNDGKLDGTWSIYDRKQRKICQWSYENGQRHGDWQWWFPNGELMQSMTYQDGVVHGTLEQRDSEGEIVTSVELENGRRIKEDLKLYDSGRTKSQATYLLARRVPTGEDDWWNVKMTPYTTEGEDIKHGPSKMWYTNGQLQQQGEYDHGLEVGEFTWWHQNGQKSLEGSYKQGKREGQWTWWHKNGQKSIEGFFADGRAVDRWVYWGEDGKVIRKTSHGESGVAGTPRSGDRTATLPDAEGPSSRRKPQLR